MSENKCRTCCLSEKTKSVCLRTRTPIDLDEDFCSQHAENLPICEVCHSYITGPVFMEQDSNGDWHQTCGNCSKAIGTCQACPRIRECEFETNPDPMPKVVMKTVQQGNMTMQTQARNEERVKKFCHSCECWMADDINACAKDFNLGCNKKPEFWTGRSS